VKHSSHTEICLSHTGVFDVLPIDAGDRGGPGGGHRANTKVDTRRSVRCSGVSCERLKLAEVFEGGMLARRSS
jgi:hypothetical protein